MLLSERVEPLVFLGCADHVTKILPALEVAVELHIRENCLIPLLALFLDTASSGRDLSRRLVKLQFVGFRT